MENKEEIKALTEEEIACVTGGMEQNKYMKVCKNAEKLYDKGVITESQYFKITENALRLSENEYKKWASVFAIDNGINVFDIYFP